MRSCEITKKINKLLYIRIDLDLSKPKGMSQNLKVDSASDSHGFIAKQIYKAKA